MNAGLLPAVVFNDRDDDHKKVNDALLLMVKREGDESKGSLIDWIFNTKQSESHVLHQLQKALLAIKVVLRAYPDKVVAHENQNS